MEENMIFTINVGDFTVGETVYPDRCLSASFGGSGVSSEVIPWANTDYNPWDYKLVDGEFICDPIELPETVTEPSETEQRLSDIEDALMELAEMLTEV